MHASIFVMHETVQSQNLIELFHRLDKRILTRFYSFKQPAHKFDLIAIGGTALGLLGLKKQSKDIDLFLELTSVSKICGKENATEFAQRLIRFIQEHFDGSEGMGADVSYDGLKSWNLLDFEIRKTYLQEEFLCFNLGTLNLVDICITKLVRYNVDDIADMLRIFSQEKPSIPELASRFQAYLTRLKNPKQIGLVTQNYERMKDALTRILHS